MCLVKNLLPPDLLALRQAWAGCFQGQRLGLLAPGRSSLPLGSSWRNATTQCPCGQTEDWFLGSLHKRVPPAGPGPPPTIPSPKARSQAGFPTSAWQLRAWRSRLAEPALPCGRRGWLDETCDLPPLPHSPAKLLPPSLPCDRPVLVTHSPTGRLSPGGDPRTSALGS